MQRHQQQCRRCCQSCTGALPDPTAKLTCPNPASGTVSELAASWLQKRGVEGLCWLQQPEGSITQLSQTRMEKVICGSLSLLPSMGLPCSPIMPARKTKRLQSFVDYILISGTSSAHKPPGRFLQPWTSMSNHFLIPAIPEQGDNKILKLLWRQSILWQKQLPQQSRQPLAHPSSSKPPTGLCACHTQSCKEGKTHTGGLWRPTSPGSQPEGFETPEIPAGLYRPQGISGNHSEEEQGALQLRLQQPWDGMGALEHSPSPSQAAWPCQVSATLGRQELGDAGCNVRLGSGPPWAGRGSGEQCWSRQSQPWDKPARSGSARGAEPQPHPLHPLWAADPWHGHCPGAPAQSQPPKERQEETRAVGQAALLQLGQDGKPFPEALEYPACSKSLLRTGMPGRGSILPPLALPITQAHPITTHS